MGVDQDNTNKIVKVYELATTDDPSTGVEDTDKRLDVSITVNPRGMCVQGNYLYVGDNNNGVETVLVYKRFVPSRDLAVVYLGDSLLNDQFGLDLDEDFITEIVAGGFTNGKVHDMANGGIAL